MRLRPARSIDAPALAALLEARLPDTRYAGVARVVPKIARQMFAQAAQRHGGTTDGATFLMIAESDAGEIEAFILGSLGRIYGVLDTLAATDHFLVGRKGCNPRAMNRLLDAYIGWADANPRVYEIGLSWADTVPDSEGIIAAYERRGFTLYSKAFRREGRAWANIEDIAA